MSVPKPHGDTPTVEHNDVVGPKALGARAVLITAVKDRGSADTRADAVCSDYFELTDIITSLDET